MKKDMKKQFKNCKDTTTSKVTNSTKTSKDKNEIGFEDEDNLKDTDTESNDYNCR